MYSYSHSHIQTFHSSSSNFGSATVEQPVTDCLVLRSAFRCVTKSVICQTTSVTLLLKSNKNERLSAPSLPESAPPSVRRTALFNECDVEQHFQTTWQLTCMNELCMCFVVGYPDGGCVREETSEKKSLSPRTFYLILHVFAAFVRQMFENQNFSLEVTAG